MLQKYTEDNESSENITEHVEAKLLVGTMPEGIMSRNVPVQCKISPRLRSAEACRTQQRFLLSLVDL